VGHKEGGGGEYAAGQNAQAKQDKDDEYVEHSVKQVSCGAVNTLALTSTGEVYVLGDNSYGQHGKEEAPAKVGQGAAPEGNLQGSSATISQIHFPCQAQVRIEFIACNGEHLFAKSALDEIYGWGRNDEGQLGVGYLTEKIMEPTFIADLSYKGIKQIACGDNYSAALTIFGEVFVAGSLEGGKLGLGKGQKRGYQLNFR
jgi:alpha-tubulin suppressor-like RCC1 family protein